MFARAIGLVVLLAVVSFLCVRDKEDWKETHYDDGSMARVRYDSSGSVLAEQEFDPDGVLVTEKYFDGMQQFHAVQYTAGIATHHTVSTR